MKTQPGSPGKADDTGKNSGVVGTDVIKLRIQSNPKKPGTKSAEDFAKYKNEMTVSQFITAIGDKKMAQAYIVHDKKKGYISIHDPKSVSKTQK